MLTFYLLLFAVIFICHEVSASNFRQWFFFLNFAWGKGLASFLIACIVLGSGYVVPWIDILTGIYFIVLSIALPFISIV
jgi:hypothetical protein